MCVYVHVCACVSVCVGAVSLHCLPPTEGLAKETVKLPETEGSLSSQLTNALW